MTTPDSIGGSEDGLRRDGRKDCGPTVFGRCCSVLAGLICFSAAFALFGLGFDFIDLAVRNDWPRWLVFAAFPVWGIAMLAVLGVGVLFICYAVSIPDSPEAIS